MKQTITESTYCDAMMRHGFSRTGAALLFEHLTKLEAESGSELDFDPVADACGWSEYDNAYAAYQDHTLGNIEQDEGETSDEWAERREDEAADWLRRKFNGTALGGGDCWVVSS